MDPESELLIVGGGPAGIMAAIEAANLGVEVTLVDENARLGGQIYRQLPAEFAFQARAKQSDDQRRGHDLIQALKQHDVRVLNETVVWGAFPDKRVAIYRNGRIEERQARAIIFATGTYERVIPFRGWTLPGVITTGGTQRLLKNQALLPGETILVAGTGPLQLIVANQLHQAGARVVAVVESSAPAVSSLLRYAPAFWGHWDVVRQAVSAVTGLRRAGIPYLRGHAVVAAEGKDRVEAAIVRRVDNLGTPVAGADRRFAVDTICVGHGFLSAYELPALAKCRLVYSPQHQSWIPWRDDNLRTSQEGIYVAGDGAGVAGVSTALAQGQLAGIMAASYLGRCTVDAAEQRAVAIRRRLHQLARLRRGLDALFRIEPGLYSSLDDDTLICRCEEVSLGVIRHAIAEHNLQTPNEVKSQTRAGMGLCQGKYCGMNVSLCIHRLTGAPLDTLEPFTPRMPVKPIPISALVAD